VPAEERGKEMARERLRIFAGAGGRKKKKGLGVTTSSLEGRERSEGKRKEGTAHFALTKGKKKQPEKGKKRGKSKRLRKQHPL